MALLLSEVRRLKYELGYNVLSVGAEPYIGVAAVFENVIQPYLTAGALTTSATAVTAATTPTPVALTLASAVGFAAYDVVVVDVDGRQERATVQDLAGAVVTLQLSKAHSGTYPVTVEGGESIVRGILQKLQFIDGMSSGGEAGALGGSIETSGIKKVDEIEFFGGAIAGVDRFKLISRAREYWRDELAAALGLERLNGGRGGGSSVAMY